MPDILVFNHWFFCVNPAAVFSGLSHLSACTMRLTVPSFRSKISGVFQFLALKQHKSVSERAGTDWRETEGQEEQAPVDVTLQRGGDHQMTVSQRGFDDPISELQNIHCIIQHVSDLRNTHSTSKLQHYRVWVLSHWQRCLCTPTFFKFKACVLLCCPVIITSHNHMQHEDQEKCWLLLWYWFKENI